MPIQILIPMRISMLMLMLYMNNYIIITIKMMIIMVFLSLLIALEVSQNAFCSDIHLISCLCSRLNDLPLLNQALSCINL